MDLDAYKLEHNSRPLDDFLGLSSTEMYHLLYNPLSENSPVRLRRHLSDDVLDAIPALRIFESLVELILAEPKGIKLTKAEFLPPSVVKAIYAKGYLVESDIEVGILKLDREEKWPTLYSIRIAMMVGGMLEVDNGRLLLTGDYLALKENRAELFERLLETYANDFNWGFLDGYPEQDPVGQVGWGFTLYMLNKWGLETRDALVYAHQYRVAFPTMLDSFDLEYGDRAIDFFDRCYVLRALLGFAERFGLAEVDFDYIGLESKVKATALLSQVFEIDED
jgi:hypothetical protein